MARKPPRNWSLDILRGVCASIVFLNHLVLWSNFAPVGVIESWLSRWFGNMYEIFIALAWPTGGQHPAVICFFVLSGFCVHRPFEQSIGKSIPVVGWRDYFIRRAKRIMPVYWTGGILGLLVVAAMHWRPTTDPLLVLHSAMTPAGVVARFGGYSGLWLDEIFAGNLTLGTVGVEILIYLAYPIFFIGAAAGRWWLLGAMAVALQFLALILEPYANPFVLFSSILTMALFWYMGALAAHFQDKLLWKVQGWWLGATWSLFLVLKMIPHFYGLGLLKQAAWGLCCMLLIGWLVDWEKRNALLRDRQWSRLLRWSGKISYPLYAVHTPVIFLVNWAILTITGSHSYSWQLAINLVACLTVTLTVHYWIEQIFYCPKSRDKAVVFQEGLSGRS